MVRQVYSFVSRVGEFKNIKDSESAEMRPVVSTSAGNINDLTAVLCAEDKMELLLKFHAPPSEMEVRSIDRPGKPEEKVGKLVHLVVSCAADLPLQTPCYAALTLSVHEHVKGSQWEGFARRCVEYTMTNIARDLDTILLRGEEQAQASCRVKLMLRYLAILAKIGIVKGFEGEESLGTNKMTVFGLLCLLTEAAIAASEQFNNSSAAIVLSVLVLSTLPYIMEYVPRDAISEKLMRPIESLLESYKSTFSPGVGISSILLKEEQLEDDDEEEEDEEEEDDEDDEDEEEDEASGQICDSLQDLLRASQRLKNEGEPSRFCLPLDAPWKGLVRRSTPNPEGGETESQPIVFSEESMYISFIHESQAISLLRGEERQLNLQCFHLDGIVFGRLPIFGSPPDPEDADDEDDEEDMEEGAAKNEQLEAFKGYSILDRYFIAETMRDCLVSHESYVSGTGVQQGSAKTAAEELLSVYHVLSGENPSSGLEYAILETILALIAQSTEYGTLRHLFLSRVLLELVRLEPSRLSPALAVAMTNLFQDYLPSLGPSARDNLSRWFAFHLINTEYQWPSAYWQLWEPYAISTKHSSRGGFVRRALNVMAENVSDPADVANQCLSCAKSLAGELLGRSTAAALAADTTAASLTFEVSRRVWDNDEDPSLLRDYLLGEEVSTLISQQGQGVEWLRTDAVIHVIVEPARQLHEGARRSIEKLGDDDEMADDSALSKDAEVLITDSIARYKQVLLDVIAKDAESLEGDKNELVTLGGAILLRRVESVAFFNSSLLQSIVSCLVKYRVVSELSVLRWLLGDLGDSISADVVLRWWTYATEAFQEGLASLERDTTGGGNMAIDGGERNSNEQFSSQSINGLNQMLQYAVKRVSSEVMSSQGDAKRPSPLQVDLIEGMKAFALNSKLLLMSSLTRPAGIRTPMKPHEVLDLLSKSEVSGSVLSGLCEGDESLGTISLLQRSLEQL